MLCKSVETESSSSSFDVEELFLTMLHTDLTQSEVIWDFKPSNEWIVSGKSRTGFDLVLSIYAPSKPNLESWLKNRANFSGNRANHWTLPRKWEENGDIRVRAQQWWSLEIRFFKEDERNWRECSSRSKSLQVPTIYI